MVPGVMILDATWDRHRGVPGAVPVNSRHLKILLIWCWFPEVCSLCQARWQGFSAKPVSSRNAQGGYLLCRYCDAHWCEHSRMPVWVSAGMGPLANCKHVRAVLCGLCDFTNTKTINIEATCTQKLQTFHKSKPYFGSPVKAHMLGKKKKAATETSLGFDPRPQNCLTGVPYQSFVRNLAINFTASSSHTQSGLNIPLLPCYTPANPYGIENDHDYGELDCFEWVCSFLTAHQHKKTI